ncbi:endoplasmic reticulum mannosyl-oligosaccharide 1,2-alpha-mannosidase [Triangularia verruculosa]|uniref:alpha-1,2-Mannosidase n=1 Tax=Triangularia verruculosa TaxID=2587418 RepID=A0AAN7AQM3_9PEZI|nr:endoplasmic reticulum mannosyl-oligosaccharide 1,2-alpha-mannosidase [Triangularia verruculosa]
MLLDRRMRRLLLVALALAFSFLLLKPSARQSPPQPPVYQDDHPIVRFHPSSFDWWSSAKQHHPVPSLKHKLPPPPNSHSSVPTKPLHPVQFFFPPGYKPNNLTRHRRNAVKQAFVKSWTAYKRHAWLSDELAPVSGHGKTTFGGWSATLIDALDTLWIMDLKSEFYLAASAACRIDFSSGTAKDTTSSVNLFETTIRHLGGLIAAYDLSGEFALLEKAAELGGMLYTAFDTPNRLPPFWLDFQKAKKGGLRAGVEEPSAMAGSLTLEFTRLAQLTGEQRLYDAVGRVVDFFEETQNGTRLRGMWPRRVNYQDGGADEDGVFSVGGLADSLYEYLSKMAALLGRGRPERFERMWKGAMGVVEEYLLFRPMLEEDEVNEVGEQKDVLFAGEARVHEGGKVERVPEGQHLGCFAGGMFGLGGRLFGDEEYVKVGEKLARGCAWAYGAFPTGVMPEIFELIPCEGDWRDGPCKFDEDKWRKEGNKKLKKPFKSVRDAKYLLRPEAIESLFIMFRITGKKELQDLAWDMFQSVVKSTETELAFSAISDVAVQGPTKKLDSMESFWLAETLKYFYLIFSPPDLISLDEWVLNTEAHPFRRDSSGFITRGDFPEAPPPRPKPWKKKKPVVP